MMCFQMLQLILVNITIAPDVEMRFTRKYFFNSNNVYFVDFDIHLGEISPRLYKGIPYKGPYKSLLLPQLCSWLDCFSQILAQRIPLTVLRIMKHGKDGYHECVVFSRYPNVIYQILCWFPSYWFLNLLKYKLKHLLLIYVQLHLLVCPNVAGL